MLCFVNTMCDLGVIRSVSAEDKAIYILTPVPQSVLENVNCIQCGAVSLPKCLRITSEVKSSGDRNKHIVIHNVNQCTSVT